MKNSALIMTLSVALISNSVFGHQEDNFKIEEATNISVLEIEVTDLVPPTCNGFKNGQASIKVTGGEAPYSYNWNTFPNQFSSTATQLEKGVYFVYVTDAAGNSAFKSVSISDPSSSVLTDSDTKSIEEMDLTSTVKSSNVQLKYTLNESIVQSYIISELPVGVHKVEIIDENNCILNQYIQVFELKSENTDQIEASAKYVNQQGDEILVSDLIPLGRNNKIAVKQKK